VSVDWRAKIQTFLYRAPWGMLEESPAEGGDALEVLFASDDLDVARRANELASALDEPCFLPQDKWNVWKRSPCLIHPLAGVERNVRQIEDSLADKVKNAVEAASSYLKSQYLDSAHFQEDLYKRLFLALWRLLPDPRWEKLDKLPKGVKAIWELLPADPRVPDHSIWDLASTASALAGTYDQNEGAFKPAFLIFTIASAQEFVSAARRTQDLWMGSFLLSYLIWRAMKPVIEEVGPDAIIFPDLRGQPLVDRWLLYGIGLDDQLIRNRAKDYDRIRIANLPNIFTAIVPEGRAEKLANAAVQGVRKAKSEIAEAVRSYVEGALEAERSLKVSIDQATGGIGDQEYRAELRAYLQQCLKHLKEDGEWKGIWERQIGDFLEPQIFWVVLPWGALGKDLSKIKTEFEELVGPLKEGYGALYEALEGCASPETGPGIAYSLLSSLAGKLLTARKNLRHFTQTEEPGHKCTQCGVREALHLETLWEEFIKRRLDRGGLKGIPHLDPYPEVRVFWQVLQGVGAGRKVGERKLAGRIRRGDRLCAVCLTKRLAWEAFFLEKGPKEGGFSDVKEKLKGEKRPPAHLLFPSTASIATAKFKESVLVKLKEGSDDLWKKLKTYVEKMRELTELIYPSAEIPKLERLAEAAAGVLGSKGDKEEIRKILLGGGEAEETGFLRLDGEWLFPESFDEKAVEREYGIQVEKEKLEPALEALRELLKVANAKGIPAPRRYLAILAMDGDKMGEWLTGRRGPALKRIFHPDLCGKIAFDRKALEATRPLGPIRQRVLSQALKNFALEIVRPVVEEAHCGRLIYAGGDDVLALLPLEELPGVIHDLQALFGGIPQGGEISLGGSKKIKAEPFPELEGQRLLLPGYRTAEETKGLTISAGVAIVHCTHPFWHAVEEAHEAMKTAKRKPRKDPEEEGGWGRDAWAISILKRSGEPQRSGGKWFYGNFDVWKDFQDLATLFKKGLSPRFIHQMQGMAEGMKGVPVEAMEDVLKTLLERREGLTAEDAGKLKELKISRWFGKLPEKAPLDRWSQVLEWLRLVHFLVRGERG